jgi:outer membrane protein assembly factor BamB
MPRRCLGCCVFLLLATVPMMGQNNAPPAKDWPQWRGPNRDGVSTETGLLRQWPQGGPKLLWNSKEVNGKKGIGRGYSTVSVANGRIFTIGDRNKDCCVIAIEEATGKELWATRLAAAKGDGPRCTPTVDGDRVYALTRGGELACLNVADGKIRWQKNFKADLGGRMMSGWEYSESPLIDGDKLICTPGGDNATLAALDKLNGNAIWLASVPNGGGAGYASVVIAEVAGIRQYITLLGRGIVGINARDGSFLWRYNRIANGTANIPTPIVHNDLVFCSTGYGTGAALLQLVPKDGGIDAKELYFLKGKTLQNHHGGTIRLGDHIYGGHGHNDGLPFCLNFKTGTLAWGPLRGPGERSACVTYADGHLYYRYENGVMALVEATPTAYRLKSLFNLPSYTGTPSWPHPVIANGRLYIRGNDVLLCYDIRQQ